MKKIFSFIIISTLIIGGVSCSKSEFAESYTDPSKVSATTVEKQFAGFLIANRDYVMPSYWNYFVVLRTTLTRYTQAVGWVNGLNQYIPAISGVNDRWSNFYQFLAQYRELEKVNNALTAEEQAEKRIYMIAAAIYFYDHTQKVVDFHGDIPWSEAGMLSANGGDYQASYAKYDGAEEIYTKMLDDLKAFADELNSITVPSTVQPIFQNQDFVNGGSLDLWKRYCNSLRLRILTRVSGVSSFQSRVTSEIAAILGDPTKYPVVDNNSNNVQIDVKELTTAINSTGFRSGLEDWDGNLAGKAMIDHMITNGDPRLRAIFQPGDSAAGAYIGLDPMLSEAAQTALVNGGKIARYNWSTLTRNEYFPGELINAAEVSFLIAEAQLKAGNDGAAKTAYEKGISQSIEFYYWARTKSANSQSPALTPTNTTEINNYIASAAVSWTNAANEAAKLSLIATQKWIHYNVIQLPESWSERRRLDLPVLSFIPDNSSTQTLPPFRWAYVAGERTYNADNYAAVSSKDELTTKIFWDVK
ncbi:MAG: SusD/RagB family nutrient-binding outer membrane lipoprotein [Chitinophagaceae bacterium]|nr:SusD/RagB family nutrient-binding outer membrane lipoprotein [Chitinophagaceae bacterium]